MIGQYNDCLLMAFGVFSLVTFGIKIFAVGGIEPKSLSMKVPFEECL